MLLGRYKKEGGSRRMKTMFVVSSSNVNKHVGEDYDAIIEVENQPTWPGIQDWANKIKDGIRGLWHQQVKEGTSNMKVVVSLDAVNAYHQILANCQIIMKAEEGIIIELPYAKPVEVKDWETLDLLRKLGEKV